MGENIILLGRLYLIFSIFGSDPHRILSLYSDPHRRSAPHFVRARFQICPVNEWMSCMSYVGQRQRSASGVSLQILKIQRAHSKSAGSIYKRRLSPNYSMMQKNEILFWKQSIAKMITIHIILPFHNHVALRRETIYCKNDNHSHNSSLPQSRRFATGPC